MCSEGHVAPQKSAHVQKNKTYSQTNKGYKRIRQDGYELILSQCLMLMHRRYRYISISVHNYPYSILR